MPPGDAVALADAIGRYLALDLPARRALGEAGRRVVEDRFGIDGTAARYAALLRGA